jgi:hypothetical protein
LLHSRRRPRTTRPQQLLQHRFDPSLALTRRQVQDPQVLLDGTLGLLLDQPVIDQAEAAGREQFLAVAVVGKRPRLTYQPVDDVPVVDAVFAPATQPRTALDEALAVPDLDGVGVQACLHPFADQAARHRVGVAADVEGAPRIHSHLDALASVDPLGRQRPQHGQLLSQPCLPTLIALGEQLPQERFVGRPAGKVAAATQHQGLVQGPLELPMTLFHVAVLVRLRRVDGLALQTVVPQKSLVATLKGRSITPWRNRSGQGIGAMDPRHAAQFGQGVLQAVTEALEALGEADGAALPVRVGQDEVVDQVGERHAPDRDLQARDVGKVRGTQPTRFVDLSEKDLLGRPMQGTPLLDVPLQGAELSVGEATRIGALQPVEHGFGLQAGVKRQLLLDPWPDLGERVGAGSPAMLHAHLTGQLAEPAVRACGLVVDAGFGGGLTLGQTLLIQASQPTDMQIGNHPKPPCRKGLRIAYRPQWTGKSNCR